MKRRILSLMMALMLCLSALPTPVWATESEDTFEVIEQAVETTADAEPDLLSELVGTDIQPDTFESLESADESEIQSDQDTSVEADEAFFPEAGEAIADAIPEAPNETDTDIELPTVMDEAIAEAITELPDKTTDEDEKILNSAQLMAVNEYIINGKAIKYTDFTSSPGECWKYACKIYNKIWGHDFTNQFSDPENCLRNLNNADLILTAEHLKTYVSYAQIGSCIRLASAKFLHANDGNEGHSQIIVAKDADGGGFTVIQGGLSVSGSRNERHYGWNEYISSWYDSKHQYIKYIKWPGAPAYPEGNECTLSINPAQSGYTINQGTSCNVTGTITSNRNITNVTASMDGNQYASWNPNSTSVNIQSSQINQGFRGSDLSAGTHTLRITATCSCGTTISADITINVIPNVPKYNLDVNGWLDGFDSGWLQDYGTFDVWINGNLVADNVPDYCADWPAGTQYALTDIQTLGAHTYHGVCEGTQSGTIGTGNVSIRLNFRTNANIGSSFYACITNKSNNLQLFNQDDDNVTAVAPGGTSHQIWRFDRLANNFYKITSARNGYSLDVESYGTASGTNVHAVPYVGNSAQTWFVHEANGAYLIGAQCTPCFIDSGGGNNNVHMWDEQLNENQLFYIQKVPFIAFSPASLELTQGESKTVSLELGCPSDVDGFRWGIDGASSEIVTLSHENEIHTTYGIGSYGIGGASVTVTGKKVGNVHITFNMLGEDGGTLYARGIDVKVSPKPHTVTFLLNTGLGGNRSASVSPGSKQVFFGDTYGDLPTPVSSDSYIFRGWYTDPDGGDRVTKDTRVTTDADHFLYAHWRPEKVTLTFNANGGNVSPASIEVYWGQSGNKFPTPTRSGYTFIGWYDPVFQDFEVTEDDSFMTDQTLLARWTANQYTVTFNPWGGTVSPTSKTVTYDSKYGELPIPTRIGYDFVGWYTQSTGGERITEDSILKTTNPNLIAHWTPKPGTLYFDANGGTVSPTSKTVAMGELIGTLPIPVRTGYTFVCWYQTSVVNSIDENTRVTADMGRTITAYWRANQYTVTFNGNGGSVSPASKTVTYDSAYGDMPVPSRSNYIFDGWYTRANGGTKVINSTKVNTAASHSLYAHWKENPTPTPTNTPTPTPTNTPTPSTSVTGDLNGDRRVSISDFSILSSIIRGNMTDFTSNQAKYGNVDGNMKNGFPILDVRDLSLIGQYLVESIDEFPARASNAHSGKTIHISFQAISNEEGGQPIIRVDPGDVFFVAVNYDAKSTGNLNMDYNLLVTFDPSNVIIEKNQSAVYDFSAEGAVGKIYSAKYMGMTPVPNKGTLFRIAFRADSSGMTEQQLNAFIASFDLDAEGIAHYNSAGDAAVWYQTLLSNYNQEVHDYVVDKTAIPTSTPTPTNTPIPVPTGKPAPNPNVPQVVIENRTVLAGSEFSVPVLLKNNPGIIGFDFIVSYDEELLELISVDNGDYALTNAPVQSPYVFNWADGTGDNRTDALAGTMNFRILNDASGTVVLRIAIRDPDNFVNANMETVAFETSDGTITIAEYSPGDVNSDGKVNNRDVILIQRHIAGWSVDFVREAADVNGDEKINNRDVILIQRKIAGWDVAL